MKNLLNRHILHYIFPACIAVACLIFVAGPRTNLHSETLQGSNAMNEVRFITLDPGHFHAALVQKEMYPGVSRKVNVYAPLGFDLIEHLNRIVSFNTRKENPTSWELEIHTGPDFLQRMLREKPGNVVIISGRNLGKIDRIKASVEAGLNVLSDKPWIIDASDFPKLESALATAERQKLVAYDIMTERYEITTILQRELVNDPGTFGTQIQGTEQAPGVYMESVHQLLKLVAGLPLRRPAWFFDTRQQGEGITDVGTHLVDLAQWILFPELAIDYRKDVKLLAAKRWPTVLTKADFQKVTCETGFPAYLKENVHHDSLDYFCNTQVSYALRGVRIKLDILWNYEPSPGGDTHNAYYRGSRSKIEIRQAKESNSLPQLYVVPNSNADKPVIATALQKKIAVLQSRYPGVQVQDTGKEFRIEIPAKYRVGHEAHFGQVTEKFLGFLKDPSSMPAWEIPNMLAKYYVTTQGILLCKR